MKHLPQIAASLLGLAFILFGLNHFVPFLPYTPAPPTNPEAPLFFGAIKSSGFLDFVKIFEILGGVLVAIPKTRNFGLLILGPIVINIIMINILIIGGSSVFQVPVIAIGVLSAYLLFVERRKFLNLLH